MFALHTVSDQLGYALNTYRQMDELYTLTVVGNEGNAYGLNGTNLMTLLEDIANDGEDYIFPNLSTLRLERVNLAGCFPRFKALLQERLKGGHPVEVDMYSCYDVTAIDVDSLKTVSGVIWDCVEVIV